MRTGISITITRSVRGRLEAITRDRNASQKHAWRAAIILSSADGVGTNEIMRRSSLSKPLCGAGRNASCMRAWTGSCATKPVLLESKRLPDETVRRVLDLTLWRNFRAAWRGHALDGAEVMARVSGVSLRVQCSASGPRTGWSRTGIRTFKLSRDPQLSASGSRTWWGSASFPRPPPMR